MHTFIMSQKQFLGEMRTSSSVAYRQSVIYDYYEEAARFGSRTVCLDGRARVTPKRRSIILLVCNILQGYVPRVGHGFVHPVFTFSSFEVSV